MATDLIEELERSLQERWDGQTLRVYADALEERGDPRGELISLDLAIEEGNDAPGIAERRRERLLAWLGSEVIAGRSWNPADVRFGFLDDFFITSDPRHVEGDYLEALLASPAGRFLRGLSLFTSAARLAGCLERLSHQPLPWLRRLSIRQVDVGPIPIKVAEAFAAAAPNLEELSLAGERVFVSPCHRGVERLRLTGGESIVVGAEAMPGVVEIDYDLDRGQPETFGRLASLLNPRTFPNLRRIDLSRNEYRYPTQLACNVSMVVFLDELEDLARIEHLRLPSVRSDDEAAAVVALLERFPHLSVDVARMYRSPAPRTFEHPRLSVPAPRPWPSRDTLSSREALTISVPGQEYGDHLALSSCTEELEVVFDDLAPAARSAWLELWTFLDGLGWETDDAEAIELPFDAATLETALASISDLRCQRIAATIQNAQLEPGAQVQIQRYWGW